MQPLLDSLELLDALDLPDELRSKLREKLTASISDALPGLSKLTSRLSLLRTFTQKSYHVAAEGLTTKPTFEEFVASRGVSPIVGYAGRHAIAGDTRTDNLSQWDANRVERARWVDALAGTLDPNDSIEQFDRIQILFLADQSEARRVLTAAFNEADRTNDIARCGGLLELVVAIQVFLDQESLALLNQIRSRAQARNLFFAEFYQSARYYPRPVEETIRQFAHSTDEKWILHLYATGGMGKTTMLRRLISHEWIIGPKHLPCAVLDFDYLEISTVLQHPTLLGLAMAAQWNEQLEQPVFGGILTPTLRPVAGLLFRTRTDASARGLSSQALEQRSRSQYLAGLSNPMRCGILAGAVPPRTLEERTALEQQTGILLSFWTDKLPEAVATMCPGRPVLLILDTLEDASQPRGPQLLQTLRLIASLRESARAVAKARGLTPPNLRLILSGRHRLGKEHVLEFAKAFSGQYMDFLLPGLEEPEATSFLDAQIGKQHVGKDRAALISAMVTKSHGIPFNLSLFAEWANSDSKLDDKTVARSEDVSTVMLIERIIKRIPYQPLRWVIRYGAVPRSLSLDFLREVMRQPLIDALSGQASQSGVDDPQSDTEQDVWRKEPDFQFDADRLWNEHVLTYAAEKNWIGRGEQLQQVVFRGDILQPMRRLLRQQKVFAQLHEQSRDWYAKQVSDTGDWNAACIECLYHSLQLRTIDGHGGTDFLAAIRKLLDSAALTAAPRLRAAVCEELRKPDFSELTNLEQAYVCYRLAEARAAETNYYFTLPDAVQSLTSALALAGDAARKVLPAFAQLWKQVVGSATGFATLAEMIKAAGELTADDAIRAWLLISERVTRSTLVADGLRAVTDAALKEQSSGIPAGFVASRLASYVWESDPEVAARYFAIAAQDFAARGDSHNCDEALRNAAYFETGFGRLRRARELLQQITDQVLERDDLLARVELASFNPGQALILVQSTGSASFESVERFEIQAEAFSQRMLLKEALDAWDSAAQLASKQSDIEALARVAIGQAKLYYWWMRVVPDAIPDSVQANLRSRSSTLTGGNELSSEIEVWQIIYGRDDPDRWRQRVRGGLGPGTPRGLVRLILALSQVTPLPQGLWLELVEHMKAIPQPARTAVFAEPVLLKSPPDVPSVVRDWLVNSLRDEPKDEVERALYGLRYGELLAWLGSHDRALEVLGSCVPQLDDSGYGQGWRPTVYRQRRRIEARIRAWRRTAGGTDPYPAPQPDPAQLWWSFWRHTPFRAAAGLVENAERALEAGDASLAQECLKFAADGLGTVRLETEFHTIARVLSARSAGPVEKQSPPLPSPPSPSLTAIAFAVVELRSQHGRVLVSSEKASEATISAVNATMETLLRSRGIPRRLIGTPIDSIREDLDEFLLGAEIRSPGQRLGLKIPLSPLCCAPWELTFADEPAPFRLPSEWTQERAVARAQRELQGPEGVKQLKALLFQPGSAQDRESPASSSYLGLSLHIPAAFLPHATGAHVLYLASSFIEIPSLEEPGVAGLDWTATSVAYQISATFQNVRPLVILDTPAPPTAADLVHQLLLRNYFAQALVDSGSVSGVLATGLHPLPAIAEVQQWLINAIVSPQIAKLQLFDQLVARSASLGLLKHDALFTASPHGPLCSAALHG